MGEQGDQAALLCRRLVASPEGKLFIGMGVASVVVGVAIDMFGHLKRTGSVVAAKQFSNRCLVWWGGFIVLLLIVAVLNRIVVIASKVKERKG